MKRSLLLVPVIVFSGIAGAWAGSILTFHDGETSSTDPFTPSAVVKGTSDVLGRFKFSISSPDNWTAVKVTYNDVRTGLTNFRLFFSTDSFFDGGDTQVGGTTAADPGDGGSITFSFSQAVSANTSYWGFVTADVAINATGQVRAVVFGTNVITFSTTGSYSNPNAGFFGPLSTANVPVPVVLSKFIAE